MDQSTKEILWQDEFIVVPGLYGPFDSYKIEDYEPGLLYESRMKFDPGTIYTTGLPVNDFAPATGEIDDGENRVILYLYSRSADRASVYDTNSFEMEPVDTESVEMEFVFE